MLKVKSAVVRELDSVPWTAMRDRDYLDDLNSGLVCLKPLKIFSGLMCIHAPHWVPYINGDFFISHHPASASK